MAILILSICLPAQAAQDSVKLEDVLARATAYVKEYEAQLGSLIGEEQYVQSASWKSMGRGMINRREQRRLISDFLILQVGPEWIGVRNVNKVDGFTVKRKVEDFQQIFDESPASILKTLNSIAEESARHNLGDIIRNINLPTFALLVLRQRYVSGFSFEKTGEGKIDGTHAWEVAFRELRSPTLVHGAKGEDQFSHGFVWIEPETGRVLKTDLNIGGKGSDLPYKVRMVVTYTPHAKLAMLLPTLMTEQYETEYHTINGRADYLNFNRFEVDAKFDLGPKPPPLEER